MDLEMLPREITVEIVSRLPVKDVLRCRSVSKSWNLLLREPHFVDMHLNRSKQNASNLNLMIVSDSYELPYVMDFPGLKVDVTYCDADNAVQCSCNGILLLASKEMCEWREWGAGRAYLPEDNLWLLNPCTEQHKQVPKPPSHSKYYQQQYQIFYYGLYYYECTKDYRIVRIGADVPNKHSYAPIPTEIMIFSLLSNKWRTLPPVTNDEQFPFIHQAIIDKPRPGLLVNSALHWISTDINEEVLIENYTILAFDIQKEMFSKLSYPCSSESIIDTEVCDLDGKLGVLCRYRNHHSDVCDIWILRDYGSPESWTKLSTITEIAICCFTSMFCIMKKGKLVLYYNDNLHHYDIKDQSLQVVHEVPRCEYYGSQLTFYTESLVPLEINNGSPAVFTSSYMMPFYCLRLK